MSEIVWRGLGTGERRRPRGASRRDAGEDRALGDDRRTVTAAANVPSGPLDTWTENNGSVSEMLVKVELHVCKF